MQKIEISSKTIIFTVFFLLFLRFLWLIRELLFSLFIAFIIMSALKPVVYFLAKRRFPRILAVLLVYAFFLSFIVAILLIIFPPLILQSTQLFKNFPVIIQNISPNVPSFINFDSLTQFIPNITNQFLDVVGGIFSNIVFVITTLFFGFYFLLEENVVKSFLLRFFEEKDVISVIDTVDKMEKRMSAWFWGELILMTTVGILSFIGLSIIGINYAVPLAVLAGLLEIVPNLGPILSMVPAMLIGFSQSYFLGFAAIALYFIVQQLENNVIVPIVMRKAVGLNPIITLIALIVGGKLAGIMGVLLAIPITLFLETLIAEYIRAKRLI